MKIKINFSFVYTLSQVDKQTFSGHDRACFVNGVFFKLKHQKLHVHLHRGGAKKRVSQLRFSLIFRTALAAELPTFAFTRWQMHYTFTLTLKY